MKKCCNVGLGPCRVTTSLTHFIWCIKTAETVITMALTQTRAQVSFYFNSCTLVLSSSVVDKFIVLTQMEKHCW